MSGTWIDRLPAGLYAAGPDVYYSDAPVVLAGPSEVEFLLEQARRSPRLRSRLCAHPNVDDAVHEMLIVHHRSTYVRPHRHLARSESLSVIRGEALVAFFEDDGSIKTTVELGAPDSGKPFYYRIPPGWWHTLAVRSEWLVYHEVIAGPFVRGATEFPRWAPDGDDAAAADAYRDSIVRRVERSPVR